MDIGVFNLIYQKSSAKKNNNSSEGLESFPLKLEKRPYFQYIIDHRQCNDIENRNKYISPKERQKYQCDCQPRKYKRKIKIKQLRLMSV